MLLSAHFGDLEIVVVAVVARCAAQERFHCHDEPILAKTPFDVVPVQPAEMTAPRAHRTEVIPLRQVAQANGVRAPHPIGRVRRTPGLDAVVSAVMGSARLVVAAA